MWDLILAPACLQFHRSTAITVSEMKLVKHFQSIISSLFKQTRQCESTLKSSGLVIRLENFNILNPHVAEISCYFKIRLLFPNRENTNLEVIFITYVSMYSPVILLRCLFTARLVKYSAN